MLLAKFSLDTWLWQSPPSFSSKFNSQRCTLLLAMIIQQTQLRMIMYQTSGVAGGSDDGPVEGNLFPALQINSKVKTSIENQIWLTFVPHVHLTRINIAIIVLAKCIYINLNNGHITILQYCYDVCYRVLRIFLHAKDLITHNMYWKHEVGEKISLAFHDIDLEK